MVTGAFPHAATPPRTTSAQARAALRVSRTRLVPRNLRQMTVESNSGWDTARGRSAYHRVEPGTAAPPRVNTSPSAAASPVAVVDVSLVGRAASPLGIVTAARARCHDASRQHRRHECLCTAHPPSIAEPAFHQARQPRQGRKSRRRSWHPVSPRSPKPENRGLALACAQPRQRIRPRRPADVTPTDAPWHRENGCRLARRGGREDEPAVEAPITSGTTGGPPCTPSFSSHAPLWRPANPDARSQMPTERSEDRFQLPAKLAVRDRRGEAKR